MASLGRPKLCWGPGSSLWPAAPLDSLCITTAPPAFGGSGRGGGRPGGGRDGIQVSGKAAGGWGREGNPSQPKGWLPKDALSRGTQGHTGPQRRVQVFTEGWARGAAGKNRDGGEPGREGEEGGGQGREPGAGKGCRERRERRAGRGGCWHAGRGRGGHGGLERPLGEAADRGQPPPALGR